jgi:hypothetical protein
MAWQGRPEQICGGLDVLDLLDGRDLYQGQIEVALARLRGGFMVHRLLGDREPVDALTPTLDHIVIDRGAQVAQDARPIGVLRQRVPVVAFVNNHYAGCASETARQLGALTDAAASA